MGGIRVLQISGSSYEMGYRHGEVYRDAIREYTEERIHLSSEKAWTGHELPRAEILALGEACLEEHRLYSPELVEELEGMAAATGLSLAELVIMNGFTDFIDLVYAAGARQSQPTLALDDCTAVIVPDHRTPDHHGFFAQTWDMHATATPYVILLRGKPEKAPAFLIFTTTGCVGQLGMNEAGIAVGINNLLGGDGQVGVMWPFLVRKALMQTTIDDALDCIVSAKRAGAHNFLLFDREGNGYNIEAMSTRCRIEKLDREVIVHTNHCLISENRAVERQRAPESQASSEARLSRATDLLGTSPITPESLMALTRDQEAICVTAKPPTHVETCGAAIMRPATGDFWAVWGLPTENEYEHHVI